MELSGSAPNLLISTSNVTLRQDKKKRDDNLEEDLNAFMSRIENMMASAIETQNHKLTLLQSSIEDIKKQNCEITTALDFMSTKYEDFKNKLEANEKEKIKHLAQIKTLEYRVEQLERTTRNTSIEIRNAPKKQLEGKEDLMSIVKNIGSALNTKLDDNDIKDVYRYNSKSTLIKPITIEFTSVLKKEAVLKAVKKFKQEFKAQLSTTQAKMDGPREPLYISESLTAQSKRVFSLARKFASEHGYKYCWSSYGNVYLRKEEGVRAVRVNNEEDLVKLTPVK